MSVNVPFHVGLFLAEVHMQLSVFSPDGEWQEILPSSCLSLLPRKAAPCSPPSPTSSAQTQMFFSQICPLVGETEKMLLYDAFPNTAYIRVVKFFLIISLPVLQKASTSTHLISASIVCSLLKRGSGKIFPSFLPGTSVYRERDRKAALRGLPYLPPSPPLRPSTLQRCWCSNAIWKTLLQYTSPKVDQKQSNTTPNRTSLASNILHCTVCTCNIG